MEDQNQSNNKAYENTINRLKEILNKDSIVLPTKVKSTELTTIVDDLFREENEALLSQFKAELRDLLKKHVALLKEISDKKKELEKLVKQKEEEFVKASKTVFSKIEHIASHTTELTESLETAVNATQEAPE